MSDVPPLKSSFELAMERLEAEDREHGVEAPRALTGSQKRAISQAREKARAKLAETEILHGKELEALADNAEKLAEARAAYIIDRQRVESALESEIARIRRVKD